MSQIAHAVRIAALDRLISHFVFMATYPHWLYPGGQLRPLNPGK